MGTFTIAGLGPGPLEGVPVSVLEILKTSPCVYLQTEKHPIAGWLKHKEIPYRVLKDLNEVISDSVRDVVYAVPGHPLIDNSTVNYILKDVRELKMRPRIIPAVSFADALLVDLGLDPQNCVFIDLLAFENRNVPGDKDIIVSGLGGPGSSQHLKEKVREMYPESHTLTAVNADEGYPGKYVEISLSSLDRLDFRPVCLHIPPHTKSPEGKKRDSCHFPLDPLVNVLRKLRGEGGCPWDREQTHLSLRPYLLEETYEVLEALNSGEMYKICEELGDLLLQIVFHAQVASEDGHFDINDVIGGITEKMTRRHPHVFGKLRVNSSREVEIHWEEIKRRERKDEGERHSFLEGIPDEFPALLKAGKVQSKAAKVGFDWPDHEGALAKVKEEFGEVVTALETKNMLSVEEEIGDLLFAVVNMARLLGVDSENALIRAIDKFKSRFYYIEQKSEDLGVELPKMSLKEMDILWEEAKSKENQ